MAQQVNINFHTFWLEACYTCKVPFAMDDATHAVLVRQAEKGTFHCPHGHAQHYCTGESQVDKIRRERDRALQKIAEKDDEIKLQRNLREAAERSTSAYRGQVTKIKSRISAGVCPCCNRWFKGLSEHMQTKHKNYKKEDAA